MTTLLFVLELYALFAVSTLALYHGVKRWMQRAEHHQ